MIYMDINEKAIVELVRSFKNIFDRKIIHSIPFDQTIKMKIIENLGSNKYKVVINGKEKNAFSINDLQYNVNDKVWVTIPCKDWDSLLIIGKVVE